MSEIRVNKVIDEAGTGAVELTQGATLPAGKTITGAGSINLSGACLLYTSPSPRDYAASRMPSSA